MFNDFEIILVENSNTYVLSSPDFLHASTLSYSLMISFHIFTLTSSGLLLFPSSGGIFLSFSFGCTGISCNFDSFVSLYSWPSNLCQIWSPCHGWLLFVGAWVSLIMEEVSALWTIEGMIPSTYWWTLFQHMSFGYPLIQHHILPWFCMYQCKLHNIYWLLEQDSNF